MTSSSSARKSEIAFGHRAESPAERYHFRFKPGWIRSQSANLVFPADPPFNQRPMLVATAIETSAWPVQQTWILKRAKWRMSDVPVAGQMTVQSKALESAGRFPRANTEGKA
jgi:hypothetical protein